MTLALIVLVVFLIVWFNDSAKKREQQQRRTKVKRLDVVNLPLQEEVFLKWFDAISDDITDNARCSISLSATIKQKYIQYNIPCWDASIDPSIEARLYGKRLESDAKSIKAEDSPLTSERLLKMISQSYDVEQDISPREQFLNISNSTDWRLWLVHNELFCCNYKDWYKRNVCVITYALFGKEVDTLFERLSAAKLTQFDDGCVLVYGRWAPKSSDVGGYYSPNCFQYIAPKDDTVACAEWHHIMDNFPQRQYSPIEKILLNDVLRAYFLNLVCLLTKKELAEKGYGYSTWWNQDVGSSHLYVPTSEEANDYPWLFA